jgi:hypothetical protein
LVCPVGGAVALRARADFPTSPPPPPTHPPTHKHVLKRRPLPGCTCLRACPLGTRWRAHAGALCVRVCPASQPGNAKFRRLAKPYYRSLACVIVMYDITRRETFTAVQEWVDDARRNTRDNIVIFLVGNKLDREDRCVLGPRLCVCVRVCVYCCVC